MLSSAEDGSCGKGKINYWRGTADWGLRSAGLHSARWPLKPLATAIAGRSEGHSDYQNPAQHCLRCLLHFNPPG